VSYDIYLKSIPCDHCGRFGNEPELPDPTYNLTPIFHLALTGQSMPNPEVSEGQVVVLGAKTESPRGLRVLNGKTGAESESILRVALRRIRTRPADFAALEPLNRWGTVDDAIRILTELEVAARNYPTNVWEIH